MAQVISARLTASLSMRLLLQSVKSVSQWRPKQQPQQSLGYSAYLSSLSSKDLRARCTSRQCTVMEKVSL